jgi:hypothetical protein
MHSIQPSLSTAAANKSEGRWITCPRRHKSFGELRVRWLLAGWLGVADDSTVLIHLLLNRWMDGGGEWGTTRRQSFGHHSGGLAVDKLGCVYLMRARLFSLP